MLSQRPPVQSWVAAAFSQFSTKPLYHVHIYVECIPTHANSILDLVFRMWPQSQRGDQEH